MARKKFTDGFEDAPPMPPDPEAQQIAFGMRAPTYVLNGDVTRVGDDLIARYPESLGWLANVRLAYLRRESKRTDNEFHPDTASGAFVRSDRERSIRPDIDAGIWVQGTFWDRFNPEQRRAWVHSLLLRFAMTPEGNIKRQRPDVAEFAQVVRIYGPWADQLRLFADGISAHGNPPPTPAAIARRSLDAQPPVN